jgi:hypothetical protein
MAYKEKTDYIQGIYNDLKEIEQEKRKVFKRYNRNDIVLDIIVRENERIIDSFKSINNNSTYRKILFIIKKVYGFSFFAEDDEELRKKRDNQTDILPKGIGLNPLKKEIR